MVEAFMSNFVMPRNHTFKIDFLGSIKSQKRPTVYVFDSKNWSKCRMSMLIDLADRYGSKQALEHTSWVLSPC